MNVLLSLPSHFLLYSFVGLFSLSFTLLRNQPQKLEMNASGSFNHTTAILVYNLTDCVLPQLNPSRLGHDSHNLITAVAVFCNVL
jgi:hypothetical protein